MSVKEEGRVLDATSAAEAEITVTAQSGHGVTGMTPSEFVDYLHANGFAGNAGVNTNYPGKAWIGFRNSPK